MQAAGQRLDLGDRGVPLVLVDHVQLDEIRRATGIGEFFDKGGAALAVPARDEDRRAFLGEETSRCPSHPAVPAGDQCDLVLKPAHNTLPASCDATMN